MSLKKAAIKGASWTMIGAISTAIIQILRPAILTRFLEKSDFGLMAILMLVLGFTQIFSDLGVSVALFSTKNITRREYSSLYWIGIFAGIILYVLMVISAPVVANFYDLPELKQLIPLIGLDLIISIAGRQFQIFRQKSMQFKYLAFIDIGAAAISFVFAIILAYHNYGVYSLIFSALAASIFKSATLIISGLDSHPLSFYLDFKANKKFYRIGLYQSGSQVMDYIASQIDIIIIGKLMNASDLGVYNLIKQLIIRPYGLINSVITRVSIPLLATINDQLSRLKAKYLEMIRLVAFINIPVYALMALFSEEIIRLIYGEPYLVAMPILQILCIWGAAASITNSSSTLIVIMGRTDLGLIWTVVRVLSNPVFIILGSQFGLLGIAWANSIVCVLYIMLYYRILIYKIIRELTFKDFMNSFSDLFIEGFILFILLYFARNYFNYISNDLITITTGVIVFCLAFFLLNIKMVLSFLSGFLKTNYTKI